MKDKTLMMFEDQIANLVKLKSEKELLFQLAVYTIKNYEIQKVLDSKAVILRAIKTRLAESHLGVLQKELEILSNIEAE